MHTKICYSYFIFKILFNFEINVDIGKLKILHWKWMFHRLIYTNGSWNRHSMYPPNTCMNICMHISWSWLQISWKRNKSVIKMFLYYKSFKEFKEIHIPITLDNSRSKSSLVDFSIVSNCRKTFSSSNFCSIVYENSSSTWSLAFFWAFSKLVFQL